MTIAFLRPGLCMSVTLCAWLITTPLSAATQAPNDPGYGQQWQLEKMAIPTIWQQSTGSPNVIVAIIDSGVDIDHPDLIENIWTNPAEIPNNSIDDDQNGYIDDVHGWDFITGSNNPRPRLTAPGTSSAGYHHGTILAGIIGAQGNNQQGIVGVNWRVSILPIRAIRSDGAGSAQIVAQAIDYAVRARANVINLSFVGNDNDTLLAQAIERASNAGVLIVAAAGNEIDDDPQAPSGAVDIDLHPLFPVCHHQRAEDLVIGVASVDRNDQKSVFSSFGSQCIDVSAPGEGIISTRANEPGGVFRPYGGTFKGTSMSAAYVSGVAALLQASQPAATIGMIKQALLLTADSIDDQNLGFRKKLGSGRVNASGAAQWLHQHVSAPVLPISKMSLSASIKETPSVVEPIVAPIKTIRPELTNTKDSPLNYFVVGTYIARPIKSIRLDYYASDRTRLSGFSTRTGWKSLGQIEVLASNDILLVSPDQEEPSLIGFTQAGKELFRVRPFPKQTKGGIVVTRLGDSSLAVMTKFGTNRTIKIYSNRGVFLRQWTIAKKYGRPNTLLNVVGSRQPLIATVTTGRVRLFDDRGREKSMNLNTPVKANDLPRSVVAVYPNRYVIEPSDLNGSEYSAPNPLLWKILFQEQYQRYPVVVRVSNTIKKH